MMNSLFPIRLMLAAGVFCALLPVGASSFGQRAADDPPAADSLAVPIVDSLAAPAADSLSDEAYLAADPMPAFEGGGILEFRRWVQERMTYPDEALARGIQGRVVIGFVIERDGTVGEIGEIVSPDSLLSEAVKRVIRQSPRWVPGKVEGEPVRVRLSIPIDFNLRIEAAAEARERVMPSFEGGSLSDFKRWVLRNLELEADVFFPGDEGWVEAEFMVNKKGKVRKVDTPNFSDADFADRVRRAISSSPLWTPAEKPYNVYIRMRFDLLLHRTPEGLCSEDYTAYTGADDAPQFCGQGPGAFRDWAYGQVDSLLGPSVSAPPVRVLVRFVVERDGTTTGISVSAPGKYASFSKLVRRAVDGMPLWTPARTGGEKVRFRVTEVLDFTQDDEPGKPALEVDPKFRDGGLMEFRRWVMETVRYPSEALKSGIQGRVLVSFIVDAEGSVGSVEILQSPSQLLNQAVENALRTAPKWTPGRRDGEGVPVKFTLPVDFRLERGKPWPVPGSSFGSRTILP